MKDTYAALLEFLIYINFNFKHDIYEHCVCDVINLNNDCECAVN